MSDCATPKTAAHQASPSLGFSRQEHWSGLPFPSLMHESEKWKWSRSVVSDSLWPHGLQPTRLLHPWDFPGKSTGVGCHCLLWIDDWGIHSVSPPPVNVQMILETNVMKDLDTSIPCPLFHWDMILEACNLCLISAGSVTFFQVTKLYSLSDSAKSLPYLRATIPSPTNNSGTAILLFFFMKRLYFNFF